MIINEYELEADLVEERPWEQRRDFLAMNPAASLPVYVDDSLHAVCGAGAIAEFIDEVYGVFKRDRRLLPDDSLERAEVRRLMDWFLVKLEQDVTRFLVRERVLKLIMPKAQGGGEPDSKALRTARANIRQHMKYLDWLAGNRNWHEAPRAKAWYQRIKSRPCMRPLLGDRIRIITPVPHYADLDF